MPHEQREKVRRVLEDGGDPAREEKDESGNLALQLGIRHPVERREIGQEVRHQDHRSHVRAPQGDQRADEHQPVARLAEIVVTQNGIVIVEVVQGIVFILGVKSGMNSDLFLLLEFLLYVHHSARKRAVHVHYVHGQADTRQQTHLVSHSYGKTHTCHIVYGKIREVEPVMDFIRFALN